MERRKKLRMGETLVAQRLVTLDQLRIALKEQKSTGLPIGRQLVALGFMTEAVLRDQLANVLGSQGIDLAQVVADPEALALVPEDFARRHHLLPIAYDAMRHVLTLATTDMFNVVALDQLRASLGGHLEIDTLLAGEAQMLEYIDKFYGFDLSLDGILREIETGEVDYASLNPDTEEYTQPVVRLVGALLTDAVKREASDIHFEPEHAFLRIRYRVDGVLEQVRSLHKTYWPGILVRLKVLSGMNIAETRAPQDGRMSLMLNGRSIDFRVSSQPGIHGENLVLRILDREKSIVPLERMGFTDTALRELQLMMARPEGILVVTGPTGSGKTTTLYSMLSHLNSENVNIMTLEDPVEYPVTLMRQSSVNESLKLDFASGIRSIMRQDPDIILVGEIRDQETAEMAFRAAMTGHQVFTTLHTNSALGVFPRLMDIGIRPGILSGNIIGVVAQRLVRKLCPRCKEAYTADEHEARILGVDPAETTRIFRAAGCGACGYKGYRGRMALIELLRMGPELDELVANDAPLHAIRRVALEHGYRPLAEDGIKRVLNGVTSLAEVARVVDLTGRA
ncbi:MAG TPA: ATPase, T2SS/T4P/T4SS family [Thiobacillaceae bacterium]|nr:ATPase, T2SS/T4P/T4SS family [Thiobacillaceae bacterium]